ncbi:cation channel family protein (macronuclear) [Tetrahymena thermophila SB210]|uniref:Cation channel family protein n=1 Tax=Tetrahymena thermophila (strain SB210) TaxID=312017 RepID=W7X393_TETTS|nr:cation channel family protein [Tetrahymena thermophila SB210]EWS71917.1 cation channel family protein [Tetrahymena thermophila SB210]|eukprot:XP_012655546.1 cation channel family protein [Tetrahymena thermophila SB210]
MKQELQQSFTEQKFNRLELSSQIKKDEDMTYLQDFCSDSDLKKRSVFMNDRYHQNKNHGSLNQIKKKLESEQEIQFPSNHDVIQKQYFEQNLIYQNISKDYNLNADGSSTHQKFSNSKKDHSGNDIADSNIFDNFNENNQAEISIYKSAIIRKGLSQIDGDIEINRKNSLKPNQVTDFDFKTIKQNSNGAMQINNQQNTGRKIHFNQIQQNISKNNFLKRLYYVIRFIKKMKFSASVRNIANLQLDYFKLINDVSFVQQNITKKTKFIGRQLLPSFIINFKIFEKDSIFMILFQILELLVILLQIFWFPLQLSFQMQPSIFLEFLLVQASIVIFVFSIIVRFNTTVYIDGNIVQSRKIIAMKYLKGSFTIDVITTLALILQDQQEQKILIYLIILRFPQILNLENDVKSSLITKKQKYLTCYELIKLIIFVLFVAHFCACGFYYVGNSGDQNHNWIVQKGISEYTIEQLYVTCLYFAIITMNTVGYGDIVPVNTSERIFVLIMVIFSCGVFGYSINTIGEIIRQQQQNYESFKVQQKHILNYLNQRQVSKQLTIKVIRQLEYIISQETFNQGKYVLDKLNDSLREEVKTEYFGKIIINNKQFKKIFSKQFLMKLSLLMKDINLYPNEILQKKGSSPTRLYFIYKGSINLVFQSEKDAIIEELNVGNIVGLNNFFCQKQYQYTLKSMNVASLIYCEYDDFVELLSHFPDDNEKFFLVRDIILQNISNNIFSQEQCKCCKQYTHLTYNCPCISVIPNRDLIVKRYSFSSIQQRGIFNRKQKKQNNLCNSFFNKMHIKEFRYEYVVKNQVTDIDQSILQLDRKFICNWDDKIFLKKIPQIKLFNMQEIKRKIQEESNDLIYEEDEFDSEEEEEEFETNQDGLTSSANRAVQSNLDQFLKKADEISIQKQLKDENVVESSLENYKEKPQRNSTIQFMNDSKRRVTLQNIDEQNMQDSIEMNMNANKKNKKQNRNVDYQESYGSAGEIPMSSKNIPTSKQDLQPQGISTLMNNIGSQMSGFTPSINTGYIPSQTSNYVHYTNKKMRRKSHQAQLEKPQHQPQQQMGSQHLIQPIQQQIILQQQQLQQLTQIAQQQQILQGVNNPQQSFTNLLYNLSSSPNIKPRGSINLPQIHQINNAANQQINQTLFNLMQVSQGGTFIPGTVGQTTFLTKTFDQYTRDNQTLENMNPFENQFDKQKDYKIYFPLFNLEKVLQVIKKRFQLLRIKIPKKRFDFIFDDTCSQRKKAKKSTVGTTFSKNNTKFLRTSNVQ